jgi:hypothetical protein
MQSATEPFFFRVLTGTSQWMKTNGPNSSGVRKSNKGTDKTSCARSGVIGCDAGCDGSETSASGLMRNHIDAPLRELSLNITDQ